jgi:hypothetical protein
LARNSTKSISSDLVGVNSAFRRSAIFPIPYLPSCGLFDTPHSWLPREVLLRF